MAGQEKKPLISVVVPVYNVEKYLPKCLDSLLAQTWQNFELILVDDGSPDGSWNIMRDYAARDSRVRIFKKENGGVSSARNFGMDEARGEYLGFVDPDDWVSPHYLEWMVEAMQEQGVRMVLVDFLDVQEGEEKTFEEYPARPEAKKITTEHYPQAVMRGGRSTIGASWKSSALTRACITQRTSSFSRRLPLKWEAMPIWTFRSITTSNGRVLRWSRTLQ